jgi:ribonuclease-3
MSSKAIQELIDTLGCAVHTPQLWLQAFTHKSYAHEHGLPDNEQLEFIGDSLLDAAMSLILQEAFPKANEGVLTKMRSTLVNNITLADLANEVGIADCLMLGKGEKATQGDTKVRILAGAFEALCAVIYIEEDFEELKLILTNLFAERIDNVHKLLTSFDPKSQLQEYVQKRWGILPDYKLFEGLKTAWRCEALIPLNSGTTITGRGMGASKLDAEKAAAEAALIQVKAVPKNT